jgi:hypothetical protein
MSDQLYEQIDCIEALEDKHAPVATLTVWVEASRVKYADVVTFKETGDKRWIVQEVYRMTRITGVNRGWGLNLPKSQRTER